MIAASAIASVPFINTFSATYLTSLFDLDYAVRTHRRAGCAGDACLLVDAFRGMMSLFVDGILRKLKDPFRTCFNTESASFAFICFECQFCHNILLCNSCSFIPVSSAMSSGRDRRSCLPAVPPRFFPHLSSPEEVPQGRPPLSRSRPTPVPFPVPSPPQGWNC